MRRSDKKTELLTAGALLFSSLAAVSVSAQGAFYREVKKDDRIYVFNNMQQFDAWDKSGEIGKSLTRLGAGPNSETLVFDSEEAVNLYSFKHDLPGEVFAQPKETPKPADPFSIKVGTTIFTDFTYTRSPKVMDSDKNSVSKSEFDVRRAYINVSGNITKSIAFRVTPDVAARQATITTTTVTGLPTGASANSTATNSMDGSLTVRLKYAYGQWNLDDAISKGSFIRFGQQQTPYIDLIERAYRYRFQGTIFMDREKFLSSSDNGISARLAFPNEYGDIHIGFYNGDSYSKAEANDQKAIQVRTSLRPLPQEKNLKGLQLTAFYDQDAPVKGGKRNRFIGALTFEHAYVNLGIEHIDAKDQSSATKAEVAANGWSMWITPRTRAGIEALFRYDSLKPNTSVDAKKSATIVGVSYWFKMPKSGLTTAIMADFEQVKYDTALGKPTEKRYGIKALFSY